MKQQTICRRTGAARCLILALGVCTLPVTAAATPVLPGGGARIERVDLQMPTGPKLAEKAIPFTLVYPAPARFYVDPTPATNGRLVSSVYRNTETGGLVFVYDMDIDDARAYTDEMSRFNVGSFAGFATDMMGKTDTTESMPVNRSADGARLSTERNEGQGSPPLFIITTDATAFDEGGTADYYGDAEFYLRDPAAPEDGRIRLLGASVTFTGLFQPVVPEPVSAPLLLAGLALMTRRRRVARH